MAIPSGGAMTRAARESVRAGRGASLAEAARRPVRLSAAERDSLMREAARVGRAGGASGALPGGASGGAGVSIGVGLPGGGPTRAERQRDSALHADNVARLARIQAQARRRADSTARAHAAADSAAAARRAGRNGP
jgi:hypothetical protein